MPDIEIEFDSVDFITIGTIGPKGRRVFYLQVGKDDQLASLIMEKQQAKSLGEALAELLDGLAHRYPDTSETDSDPHQISMTLRDPVDPLFRISQLGLGYDEEHNMIVLVAQELLTVDEDAEIQPEPRVVRARATRAQMRALSNHAETIVKEGRADPKTNGYMIYYWT